MAESLFTPAAAGVFRLAQEQALRLGHSYVGSAHLLLALVSQNGSAGQILKGFGLDATVTEDMTALLYGKGTAKLPIPQGLSSDAKQILRGAAREAMIQKKRQIRPRIFGVRRRRAWQENVC